MIRVGVIGYGYWGPNLVRNFFESGTAEVRMVSDLNEDRLDVVRARYPSVQTTPDHGELMRNGRNRCRGHCDTCIQPLQVGDGGAEGGQTRVG